MADALLQELPVVLLSISISMQERKEAEEAAEAAKASAKVPLLP